MKRKLNCLIVAVSLLLSNNVVWGAETTITVPQTVTATENTNEENQLEVLTEQEITPEQEASPQPTEEPSLPSEEPEQPSYIKGDQIILTLDKNTATVNGNPYTLNTAPIAIEGRTYLPLRFIVDQVLQAELKWEPEKGTITVTKEGKEIVVTIGQTTALVDGVAVNLDAPPIVKNGSTLLPLRFMSDHFNISITYDKATKMITLTGPDKGPNTKPIAGFTFSKPSYVAGQVVSATSTSYDPDGHKLVDKLWSVVGEKTLTNKELSNMFKTPRAGVYTIGLQVQDQYGLWSDWTYQEITILPNEAPVITYLGTEKKEYAQGEDIRYQFFYNNEDWEAITNQKWTYRKEGEPVSKAILGKPDALFTEGTYIISLQLDDAYGNRSELVETSVHITDEVVKKELAFRFTEGHVGDIIDNYQGFNYRDYKDIEVLNKTTVPGTMLMSDSPEVVSREGILYRDSIKGAGRILLHHINNFSEMSTMGGNKRLVIVAENKTAVPVTVNLSSKTIRGPVNDILYLGQKMLNDYLTGSGTETITLAPGEKQYIYDSGTKWIKGSCISGLMDVNTTGDVTFTIASVSAWSTLSSMDGMELFLKEVHPRGTFDTTGINYSIVLDGSIPEKLLIGTGEEEWVKGYDALSNEPAQNKGNFGVSYYITITAKEDTGIILNPRADMFRGAIEWQNMGVYNIPTVGNIYSNTAKAVSLGTIKAGETKTIEYMLPNGSSAPVLLGFIPASYWDN